MSTLGRRLLVQLPLATAALAVGCRDASTPVSADATRAAGELQRASASGCRRVQGKFVAQSVTGAACTSPTGVCQAGVVSGGTFSSFTFVVSTLLASVETPTTGVVFATGDRALSGADGDLYVKDALALRTTGGEYAGLWSVVGGTAGYLGATGLLRVEGTGLATAGDGRFDGQLCTP